MARTRTKRKFPDGPVETAEEYLARGGTITICEPGARTEDLYIGQWGRRNQKAKTPKKAKAKK
jgi:hypothetical protein